MFCAFFSLNSFTKVHARAKTIACIFVDDSIDDLNFGLYFTGKIRAGFFASEFKFARRIEK
jgi:hypothetical protein